MRTILMATASAVALLLAAAAWPDDARSADQQSADAAEQRGVEAPINGEDLADDPAHGMGEGDDAVGGGVATHTLEGERGYASLDDEERQEAHLAPDFESWVIDGLLGAAIVDSEGQEIGGIEDLIVDEDDRIRKVVVALAGYDESFVMLPLEELRRAEGDAGDELVFTGDSKSGDYERVRRQDERWLPQEG